MSIKISGIIYLALAIAIMSVLGLCGGITYTFEYNGEPAGDVSRFDQNGNMTVVDTQRDIDLKHFSVHNGSGTNLTFELRTVSKQFTMAPNVKYVVRIFTTKDNNSGYNISFKNGKIELVKITELVESTPEDISGFGGIVKIKNEDVLIIDIPKDKYLKETELTYLGVDAFSWKTEGNFTYIDYISNLPGHPGTIAPDLIDDQDGKDDSNNGSNDNGSNTGLLILILIVISVIVILVILIAIRSRRKKIK